MKSKNQKTNHNFTIVVDTREQLPYSFGGKAPVVFSALSAGDYSIQGLEHKIAIERKSKSDAFGTIGKGRDRFVAELERLSALDFAGVVIEASLGGLLRPPKFSKMHPSSVVNSLIAWAIRYRVHIFFADNRMLAEALTFRVLEKYWKGKEKIS